MIPGTTTWEADSIEIKEIGEHPKFFNEYQQATSVINLINFKNLHVNKSDKKEPIRIDGHSFLATLHHFYHHSVVDMMGTFYFIKKEVPELKCYFNSICKTLPVWRKSSLDKSVSSYSEYLKYNPFGFRDKNPEFNQHEFINDLVDIFSEDKQIHCISRDYIIFENFYLLIELPTAIASTSYEGTRDIHGLSKYLMSVCFDKPLPKKIYISRQKNNLRYKKELELKPEVSDQSNPIIRVYKNENYVEDYFNSIGYHSVVLEGMPMRDQLNIFHNATHVAGLNGSGFVNLLASKPGTKVIELDLIPNYQNKFNYESLYRFKEFEYNVYRNHSMDMENVIEGLSLIKEI